MSWYIDLATQSITSIQPDMTGRTNVNIAIADNTDYGQLKLHIDSLKNMLSNPFASLGVIVITFDLPTQWYMEVTSSSIRTVEPDLTGKTIVPINIPNGTSISDVILQLNALELFRTGAVLMGGMDIIIKISIG